MWRTKWPIYMQEREPVINPSPLLEHLDPIWRRRFFRIGQSARFLKYRKQRGNVPL